MCLWATAATLTLHLGPFATRTVHLLRHEPCTATIEQVTVLDSPVRLCSTADTQGRVHKNALANVHYMRATAFVASFWMGYQEEGTS